MQNLCVFSEQLFLDTRIQQYAPLEQSRQAI